MVEGLRLIGTAAPTAGTFVEIVATRLEQAILWSWTRPFYGVIRAPVVMQVSGAWPASVAVKLQRAKPRVPRVFMGELMSGRRFEADLDQGQGLICFVSA